MAETVKGIWLCRSWLQALGCFIGFLYRLQHWGHILWPEVMRGVTCSDPRQVALFPSVLGSITSHTIPEWALVQQTLIPTCLSGIQKSGIEFTIWGLFIKPSYNVQRNLISEMQENQGMNEQVSLYFSSLFVSDFSVWFQNKQNNLSL